MSKNSKPRAGSLQFWPRKRIRKFLPSVNWGGISDSAAGSGLLGVIAYKVGMASCVIKDNTPDSMTKDRKITVPVTVLEAPVMKIFSARFYKNGIVKGEVLAENIDKEMKRKLKLPKPGKKKNIDDVKDYNDARIIVYSQAKQTGIKKTPDIAEIGFSGSLDEKIKFIKEKIGKDILASDILKEGLVDVRGLTTGKGLQGAVKRFGITLKQHKSEKGVRRAGNIGPWHPAHTTFRTPMAGQVGLFTRMQYNSKIIKIGKENINPKQGWKNYGNIRGEYIILQGSVPGPAKRQLLITKTLRPTKSQIKKQYEFVRLIG